MYKNVSCVTFGLRALHFILAFSLLITHSLGANEEYQHTRWSNYINWRNQINTALSALTTGFVTIFIMKCIGLTVHHKYDNQSNNQESKIEPRFPDETFESVAGMSHAITELEDIVQFLKSPERYTRFGAHPPRGVLFVGAPGNGKTLLAKALAGETECSFYNVSGSEFVEMWVGLGAARVRELFDKARKHAPSIIFIDEIDAIGRNREAGGGGGGDEFAVTLNQLLVEMDGFSTTDDVIVVAATNRPEILDPALLRPGRFDRQIEIPYPDRQARKKVLELHAEQMVCASPLDLDSIARRTNGYSCADLANLVNEAAILAARRSFSIGITQLDIEEAYDKGSVGVAKEITISEREKKEIAYHEAGHALINMLYTDLVGPLHKVTIVPHVNALGVSYSDNSLEERFLESKEMLLARICIACAGRASEEIVCKTQSSGAASDFQYATTLARHMVSSCGMSDEIGIVTYDYETLALTPGAADRIDQAVRIILNDCMKKTKELLIEHKDKLEILAQELLLHETLEGRRAYELVGLPYIQGGN